MNLSENSLFQMTPTQFLELGMDNIMSNIREDANRYKLRKSPECYGGSYMIGRLHGLWYFGSRWTLWNDSDYEYDRLEEKFMSYKNEAEFLYGEYQND